MNKKSFKVVGIDLGTTNSCVAVIDGSKYEVLCNKEDGLITPSYVAFELDKETGKINSCIGEAAQRQAYINAKNTIYVFKRLIGKNMEEVKDVAKYVNYQVEADSDGKAAINVFGEKKSPIYISGIFLQNLIEEVKARAGCEIKDVVITVPANFNNAQREATKQAGEIAGLNVLRIISEPTAAAMAYGTINKEISGNVIVYDLGGGTFDVTVLDIQKGFFNVKATGGDMNLGGEDFDKIIFDWVISEFEKQEKIKLTDAVTLHRIRTESKKAKELLSSSSTANINIPYVAPGPKHINLSISKAWFEDKIREKILYTIKIAKDTLKDADVKISEVQRGILVGGSTRIKLVHELLKKEMGIDFHCDISPDTAVAIGAAYQASALSGKTDGIVLMDVTPLNIGIETVGGVMTSIISANAKIPSEAVKLFTTARDNQEEVDIKIYEGNRPMVEHNKLLDVMKLSGIKPAPRGAAKINVKLSIDSNGILLVNASEETSNISKDLTISMSNSVSNDEIKKMQEDAEKQKEADEKKLQETQNKNECDNIVYELEKKLSEMSDDKEKKEEVEGKLKTIKESIDKDKNYESALKDLRTLMSDLANYLAAKSKPEDTKSNESQNNKDSKDENNENNKEK